MGIGRSAFYDTPEVRARDLSIVAEMKTICDEFEAYGYRRVDAELRHRGIVVNAKKIRRLMREHALNPRQRRRFIATTDSDHNYPIFPNLAKNMKLDGPNQLWVADITYVTIATGFVYLAAILDAWSRRVIGYAIGRSIDARLAVAALKAAIGARDPPRGCVHHSDRGSQYASDDYRAALQKHGLTGSMGRRGNPYDKRQGRELHEDTQGRSRVSDGIRNLRGRYSRPSPLHRRGLQHPQTPLRARLSEPRAIRGSTRPATCQKSRLKLSTIKGALHWTGAMRLLKTLKPAGGVNRRRYTIGLYMLVGPTLYAWIASYAPSWLQEDYALRVWVNLGLDAITLASLFVLGGDFWDKVRALFLHGRARRLLFLSRRCGAVRIAAGLARSRRAAIPSARAD